MQLTFNHKTITMALSLAVLVFLAGIGLGTILARTTGI